MSEHTDYWTVIYNPTDIYEPYKKMRWHDLDSCLREVRAMANKLGYLKLYDKVEFRLTQFSDETHETLGFWHGWVTPEGVLLNII